jgi:hypothetical protein
MPAELRRGIMGHLSTSLGSGGVSNHLQLIFKVSVGTKMEMSA